jgi:valyl-tRNA synthetase
MTELPKTFDAASCEERWLRIWQEGAYFQAHPESHKPAFCLVIPPPNVTGALHMGHALVNTIQDILCRWKRMSGEDVLWVPGTDHAGIATQTVVERHLLASEGKRRQEFGREDFLARVWEWKEKYGERIVEQLKALGCSCDWSRQRFTLDATCNRAVLRMFKLLFEAGLIYRGDRLVNWDPVTQTALADDEVEYEEKDGFLWTIAYPLKDGSGEILVATSRPETMLGDVAVAVHPDDPRYRSFLGKELLLPLSDRSIPVVGDHRVERDFGTGAVKITPAHDHLDWEIGQSHSLPAVNVMTADGRLRDFCGPFAGLSMEAGRTAVVSALQELGLLRHVEKVKRRVGVSYRSKAVIEPFLSKQWFVRASTFKQRLHEMVQSGEVDLIPGSWDATYYHWIDNLRDWCISRQLWWGHRIPIWYRRQDHDQMICWDQIGTPPEVAADPDAWEQDPDVLDTWFSSALWPFAVLGWPDQTVELSRYYPNSVLVTGWDILFFWVARMLMAGEFAMGQPPFPKVFLHGLIYGKSYWKVWEDGSIHYLPQEERLALDMGAPIPKDVHSRWEKMSKSKGNVIDPVEIARQYGTDAMRMALVATNPQARQIDLDRRRFDEAKNFMNKVWNGARFVLMNLTGERPLLGADLSSGLDSAKLGLDDRWILERLAQATRDVQGSLERFSFDQAAHAAYSFFWDDFCSVYVETAKPALNSPSDEARKLKQKILLVVLCSAIRLLHPMTPFITEELFSLLKGHLGALPVLTDGPLAECLNALQAPVCAVAPFPKASAAPMDLSVMDQFSLVQRMIHALRNIRGEMQVPPGMSVDVFVVSSRTAERDALERELAIVKSLVRVGTVIFQQECPEVGMQAVAAIGEIRLIVPLPAELRDREGQRLDKEVLRLEQAIAKSPLHNAEFIQRAPEKLVATHREALQKLEQELAAVRLCRAQVKAPTAL